MKIQIVTPYGISHLQRYGVTVCGNVTSVYPSFTLQLASSRYAFPDSYTGCV
jgi:hypothetical protein